MRKSILLLIAAVMGTSPALRGRNGASSSSPSATTGQTQTRTPASTEVSSQSAEESATAGEGSTAGSVSGQENPELTYQAGVHVGSLKGSTFMGLVSLTDRASKGEAVNAYEFTMVGKTDELMGKIADGNLGVALVPANVTGILYNKTQGNVAVLDINTLGVLYMMVSNDSITSIANLRGRNIYMTGKGATPEYVMNYLLRGNGLSTSDVNLQFKSEVTEVTPLLKKDSNAIGVLPQPLATAVCIQNPDLKTALDLTGQ